MEGWGIQSNVGKIQVQRNKDALFTPANLDQFLIGAAGNILGNNGMTVVPGTTKEDFSLAGDILVEFEAQPHG